MRTDSTNIGETIRILRRARNISRAEMAEEIGISMSHLEKIESGAKRPGIDTYLGKQEGDRIGNQRKVLEYYIKNHQELSGYPQKEFLEM